jgi:hypothetical protein
MFSVAFTLPLMILKLRRKHVWRDPQGFAIADGTEGISRKLTPRIERFLSRESIHAPGVKLAECWEKIGSL